MLLVVGGHSRKIGKTAVVAGLIRRFRQMRWTALKVTQHGNTTCVSTGGACDCGPERDHAYALTEELEPSRTDTGRYLAAGAERSLWLRSTGGRLFESAAVVRKIIDQSPNTIIESDSIVEFFDPDLYLVVLDYACEDFKLSTLRHMDRADACVVIEHGRAAPVWQAIVEGIWEDKPRFAVKPPAYVNAAVTDFVSSRLTAAAVSLSR